MKKYIIKYILIVGISLFLSEISFAQGLSSEISLYKVFVNAQNEEALVKAEEVEPNDLLEYQVLYKNGGSSDISSLQPVLPVPQGLKLITDELNEALVSVDGIEFSSYPIMKTISKDDKLVSVPVDENKYRFIKWKVDRLNAGQKVILKARMSVL